MLKCLHLSKAIVRPQTNFLNADSKVVVAHPAKTVWLDDVKGAVLSSMCVACGWGVSLNPGNPVHCMANEFRCNDGSCIRAAFKCDNVTDCLDRSDELNCRRKSRYSFLSQLSHQIGYKHYLKTTIDLVNCINTWFCAKSLH